MNRDLFSTFLVPSYSPAFPDSPQGRLRSVGRITSLWKALQITLALERCANNGVYISEEPGLTRPEETGGNDLTDR